MDNEEIKATETEEKTDDTNVSETSKETETTEVPGVVTIKLRNEFEFEGITYKEFKLDFNKLKGKDLIAIENEMTSLEEFALTPEISPNYCARIAAKAAGVSSEVIANLPLKDFNNVKNAARRFLTDTD
ncbi:MAG: phage tail assembly protein [Clostridia bacterium]|jgi:hypothetical protein|nr:phage tail assembly protein [Clostridia bacterium]